MKAHIGTQGVGTRPLCSSVSYVTSGYSVDREQFWKEADEFRCKRCEKKAAPKPRELRQ